MPQIKRMYIRRYNDSGQITAYVEWASGARTEGAATWSQNPRRVSTPTFGPHMHVLFARGKRQGLKLERETW